MSNIKELLKNNTPFAVMQYFERFKGSKSETVKKYELIYLNKRKEVSYKLLSNEEINIVLNETNSTTTFAESFQKCVTYANFLKQPLKLEMFVPCDEDGNVLEEPEEFKDWIVSDHYFNASESVTHQCRMYKKAKEKVLFEGFSFKEETADLYFLLEDEIYTYILNKKSSRTIENLIGMFNLKLTENPIK